MSAKRKEINRITAVMKDHDEQLSSYPNVVGFGVGYKVKGGKKLDRLAIIVLVKKKLPLSELQQHEIIPTRIRGILTDVQESGELFAYPARTDKWRPAPPGVSIGHYLITAGTFGCVVLKSGIRKILSNNHVLANCNAANVGDAIYQPGVYDGGGPGDTIALLEDWIPIVFSPVANNVLDGAIAAPINDDDILNEILDIGVPTDVVEAELDMSVVKSGRTTAVTYGTITAINATVSVNYGAPGIARFIEQIIMTYMLAGGDSGSLLLTNPEHEAVGLCFAGSPSTSVANKIQYAESLLGISIVIDLTDASTDLPAQFTVKQWREDLPAQFEVGQGSRGLLGKAEIRHEGSSNLSGAFDGQTSVGLPAEFIVRQLESVELLGEFRVRHETSVDFHAAFDGQVSLDLAAKIIITRAGSVELSSEFSVRHAGIPIDLLGSFEGQVSVGLPGEFIGRHFSSRELKVGFTVRFLVALSAEFIVRHSDFDELSAGFEIGQGWENLTAEFIVGQDFIDLLGTFTIRLVAPYLYWTNRRWVNSVVELSEASISDAFLEEIITGVMNDIKTWLIANEVAQYSSWIDIDKTPMAIRRATTYGVVASLYARNAFGSRGRFVVKVAPVDVKILATNEAAMEYWEGMMIRVLELYLSAQDLDRLWIDTIREDPVFSMEDTPLYRWNPE